MQQFQSQSKFCEAREHISDNELRQLSEKYHRRHPTFSLQIQERTCKSILLICNYHYRHIVIDLKCQCTYNEVLHQFEKQWTTDNSLYKSNLNRILSKLESTSTYRSLPIQIEMIIDVLNNYFIQSKSMEEEKVIIRQKSTQLSIDKIPSGETIQSRRRSLLERSLSWSHPFSARSTRVNSMLEEKKEKN